MDALLYKLLKASAPSGYGEAAQTVFKEYIAPYVDEIKTDTLGTVYGIFGKKAMSGDKLSKEELQELLG